MLKEALFWKKLKNKFVQCQLCPHFCILEEEGIGKCRVRQNKSGRLMSLFYGKPCCTAVDPIEKKPLFHFLPGEDAYSMATVGCNFSCLHCQNADISQVGTEKIPLKKQSPEEIVRGAKESKSKIIAYTYTEPTIFYEYMLDIAKLAKKRKLKNVIVSNGYINPKPLKKLCRYIDGANIDLKSISDKFYQKVCGGSLKPVLRTLKVLKENRVWFELTNLLIPGYNDSEYQIKKLVGWVRKNLGTNVPIHFIAFFPTYQLLKVHQTPLRTLQKARKIALKDGLKFIYTGNLKDEKGWNTYCPKCKEAVIVRKSFYLVENKLKRGKCACGKKIPGVWK